MADHVSLQAALPDSAGSALLFALLTAVGMLAGALAVIRYESWTRRHLQELIAFAAGLLIAGALLHVSVHAVELLGPASGLAWTLAGFLLLYVGEAHFIPHVHARGEHSAAEATHDHVHLGPLVVSGLAIHSMTEGLAIGAGLSAGSLIGWVTLVLVVAHKLPVGIAAASALFHSGVSGGRALMTTAALSSVTPIAVLVSYFTLRDVSDQLIGILLAIAGGSFLYVGAADLLPEGQATGRFANTLAFFIGCAIMIALRLLTR